jgi:DsbC/DsbD-like thiol-disulfide interchange protein
MIALIVAEDSRCLHSSAIHGELHGSLYVFCLNAGAMTHVRDSLPATLFCALLLAGPAWAGDSSDWSLDIRSGARLIAASAPKGIEPYRAGVELRLDPGWHTYWRYPGDSGVPPRIDFDESDNLRDAKVLYPAPRGFTDETGTFIGYQDHVIFPVLVTPRDPAKPVKLKLDLFYAVCEKLCVPASGHADLVLAPGQTSGFDDAIAAAEKNVPRQVTAQAAGVTVKRVSGGPKPLVAIDVATSDDIEIFAEGPTAEWALPIPKLAQGAPAGHRQFSFALDGLPPGTDPKSPLQLTFTIVGRDRAVETTTHLD